MVFAEDIRKTILKLAEERGPENTFGPSEVAQRVDKEHPNELMEQIYFVASVLIKEGKITTHNPSEGKNLPYSLQFRKASRV